MESRSRCPCGGGSGRCFVPSLPLRSACFPRRSSRPRTRQAKWRRKQSLRRTRLRRPDMYEKLDLSSKQDRKLLKEMEQEDLDDGIGED